MMTVHEGGAPPAARPSVTVVIPVYNEGKRIRLCLEALISNADEIPDEILIIDNNCKDDTIAIAQEFPGIRVIREERQGIVYARATGFDAAACDVIAGIDADSWVSPEWMSVIKDTFAADAELAAIAGGAAVQEFSPRKRFWGSWYYRLFRFWHERSTGISPVLYGYNSAFRTSAWRAVRESITFEDGKVSEDIDLTICLLKHGLKIMRCEAALVKCQILNSMKFGKLKGYYHADGIALARHEFGNRRRWV